METITNKTYDELSVGDSAERKHLITDKELQLFAVVSGDRNPLHLDEEFAAHTPFKGRIAHGMLSGALISAALAMDIPGPGTVYLGQDLSFKRPVRLGDELTITLTVKEKKERKNIVVLECLITNQDGKAVVTGDATVMAPAESVTIDMPELPTVSIN
ncbi:MAG: MaoC family dehydratase N-terminal domain-containing protein [Oceanobacter sp.]